MKKIYLIDDQPISNFITKKLLELEGFDGPVKDFTDPAEAFQDVAEDHDALIFLDLNMPVMSGWDFLDAMKDQDIFHRIIILTSSTSKVDMEKAQQYSCVVKYMVKPMNKQKLSELSDYLKAS